MGEPDGPLAPKRASGPLAPKRESGQSRFFSGQLLTAEDFAREQQYVREKLQRHNRTLHGFGIVSGLKVKLDSGRIVVGPGLALDCEGNEILIETPQTVTPPFLPSSDTPSSSSSDTSSISVSDASSVESIASSGASSKALPSSAASRPVDSQTAYLNVRFVEDFTGESFALEVARENCNRSHRHLRARWLACGQPHALTIAKLRRRSHGWTIDRGYRPPSVK